MREGKAAKGMVVARVMNATGGKRRRHKKRPKQGRTILKGRGEQGEGRGRGRTWWFEINLIRRFPGRSIGVQIHQVTEGA